MGRASYWLQIFVMWDLYPLHRLTNEENCSLDHHLGLSNRLYMHSLVFKLKINYAIEIYMLIIRADNVLHVYILVDYLKGFL